MLPLSRFLNGHTRFVQHAHTLPNAEPPLAVHMTYQFAEGAKFAHGKRQRLREAGLWLVDDDAYYNGRYVTVAAAAANAAGEELDPRVHSRRRSSTISGGAPSRQGAALAARRRQGPRPRRHPAAHAVLLRLYVEGDEGCRVGGAETMRLPFDCPMDHVLDTPRWLSRSEASEE